MHRKTNHVDEYENKNGSTSNLNFDCEFCDFQSRIEDDLDSHTYENHEVKCVHCGESIKGKRKFENHVCRLNVKNPVYLDMYSVHEELVYTKWLYSCFLKTTKKGNNSFTF